MRIVSGKHKGLRLQAPTNLPVRPTTDFAKEALFNILQQWYDIDELKVLDLFAGTGNMSYEFLSRGCKDLTTVDKHPACVKFMSDTFKKLGYSDVNLIKADVFKWLETSRKKYDLIFADPPYDLSQIPLIVTEVMKYELLSDNGTLVVEHATLQNLSSQPGYTESRSYGSSTFSFFSKPK